MLLRSLVKALVLPPAGLILLAVFGLLLARRWRRTGRALAALAGATLVLLCLPCVVGALLATLQTYPPLPPDYAAREAQAIVVLAADLEFPGAEYGGPTVGPLTLQRLRYAARLAGQTGLPVLASGGQVEEGAPPLAVLMKAVLEEEHGVEVRWIEDASRTTHENARDSAELLLSHGIGKVLLVTHAWHMPRAVAEFRAAGLDVLAAPTAFHERPRFEVAAFLPSARALILSRLALHEWLGLAWRALAP